MSSLTLIVPAGENQEGGHRPQSAHACEHICCAFNGGFPRPYAFMSLRELHGIRIRATTHAEYTIYALENIPPEAIEDSVKFIGGVFNPTITGKAVQRELSVIRAEIQSGEPNEGLAWAYAYWIRQGDKHPTADAIIHRGVTSLSPETVMSFHREFYVPSRCACVLSTSSSYARSWDTAFMSHINAPTSWVLPAVPTRPAPCQSCQLLNGVWMVPSTKQWMICSRAFEVQWSSTLVGGGSFGGGGGGEGRRSDAMEIAETKARCLIASCTRLSHRKGSTDVEMTLMDYLRTHLGVAYHISGSVLPIKDSSGRMFCIAILATTLSRHLTRSEVARCDTIISEQCAQLPCRGALNNLFAWFVQHREGEPLREGFQMLQIPSLASGEVPLNWDLVKRAHTLAKLHSSAIIFSSAE